MEDVTNEIASKHLGQQSKGIFNYDPSLLVAIPRELNRKQYNIQNKVLPFDGCDVWHAYEFSALTKYGIPLTRVLKLQYSCKSEFLVESKSLKLYLNSFNMTRIGNTLNECLKKCKEIIENDLSAILKTRVNIQFLDNNTPRTEIFKTCRNIMEFVDDKTLIIEKFNEAPDVLETEIFSKSASYFLTFDSLRSNCRVTHQPDFGDVYIFYTSKKHIIESSLVKYLVSFRSENHFHEECCEMIYKRLSDILDKNDKLMVCALYTRRGGIDICPIRFSHGFTSKDINYLTDVSVLARRSLKQ